MPGRVAFVPLRYGPRIVGGSEALTREIAMGLAGRGWDVEILTTRVVDHQSMADELPEGVEETDGLTVRRFSTSHHWSLPGRRAQWQIQDGIVPPADDQWTWVGWRFTIPDLYHHLLRHGSGYDAVVFSPYMFWNTTACVGAVEERAVVMPCLHDETYARLEVMRPAVARARSVWFLSEPEHQLAHRLGPVAERHTVTGAGIHVPESYDPQGFRARHGIDGPFLLYAGRREADKGWGWLVRQYADAVAAGMEGVDLVTFGSGEVDTAAGHPGRVIDLGFVSEQDRNDAFAAALAYVQPSRMESFSRTVMEAWLAGTPVLAVDGSEVVGWHMTRSGGGGTFGDGNALAGAVASLRADPEKAAAMAEAGRRYVLGEYSWPVVLDRMESDLEGIRRPGDPTPVPPAPLRADRPPVLVVGSYPPVPVPGAQATVAQVRRLWAEGRDAAVVSPRLSAAHLNVPVRGLLAGRRLTNVAAVTGADDLVLVCEAGLPLAGPAAVQILSAALLRSAMRKMGHVRLVRVGDPRWVPGAGRMLLAAADEVVDEDPGAATPGVTVQGPAEMSGRQQMRRLASRGARRVLGRRAPAVRRLVSGVVRSASRRDPGRDGSGRL